MKIKPVSLFVLIWVAITSPAEAACACLCVNGKMRPICERTTDIAPICPLAQCPLGRSVEIKPLNTPMLPPAGTSKCRQSRLCDRSGKCWWEQLCR